MVEQAGETLARIHQVRTKAFGDVVGDNFGTASGWGDCLVEEIRCKLTRATAAGALEQDRHAAFLDVFEAWRGALNQISTPVMIHGDYHFGNILFQGDKITCVLDFEWGSAADREYEFRNYSEMFGTRTGYEPYLLGAYFAVHRRSENFAEKLILYRLAWRLELLAVAFLHWEEKLKELIKQQTLELLAQAERDAAARR